LPTNGKASAWHALSRRRACVQSGAGPTRLGHGLLTVPLGVTAGLPELFETCGRAPCRGREAAAQHVHSRGRAPRPARPPGVPPCFVAHFPRGGLLSRITRGRKGLTEK